MAKPDHEQATHAPILHDADRNSRLLDEPLQETRLVYIGHAQLLDDALVDESLEGLPCFLRSLLESCISTQSIQK